MKGAPQKSVKKGGDEVTGIEKLPHPFTAWEKNFKLPMSFGKKRKKEKMRVGGT